MVFLKPSKIMLVVNHNDASKLFGGLGVKVVCSCRYLGEFVGERSVERDFFKVKYVVFYVLSCFLKWLRLNLKQLMPLCLYLYSLNGCTCKELSWIVQPLLVPLHSAINDLF